MGAGAALLAATLLLAGAAPAAAKSTPCPPGVFVLDATSALALGALLGAPATTVDLSTPGRLAVAGCEGSAKVRAKKKATKVTAKLGTCGTATRVKLKARIAAPACTDLRGA